MKLKEILSRVVIITSLVAGGTILPSCRKQETDQTPETTATAPITTTFTPEATATAEIITTRQVEQEIAFPTTPQEASTLFGATADRWEISAEGGWHLIEDDERTMVNPAGFVLEGYYDQEPGKNPRQFVSTIAIEAQGVTIWNLRPDEAQVLFDAMAGQKGYTPEQANQIIDRVGWTE